MSDPARIVFKEWLPDQSALGEGLIDAKNVLPLNGTYEPYAPLFANGTAASAQITGAFGAFNGIPYTYVSTPTRLFLQSGGSFLDRSAATYTGATSTAWAFDQFDNLVIATNFQNTAQFHTVGAATNFATLVSLQAAYVGIINRFVVLGNIVPSTAYIRWSAIDDPDNWPTPNSSTAIATQSGEQFFDLKYGDVTGFAGGDQHGLVFQSAAVTRMTYVGGSTVFQFDKVSYGIGCAFPFSIAQYAGVTYFANRAGIFATDGVTVRNISQGKCSNYFDANRASSTNSNRIRAAVDRKNGLIYFAFPNLLSGAQYAEEIIIYSVAEDRFTRAVENVYAIHDVTDAANGSLSDQYIRGYDTSLKFGTFSGTPGTAILETKDSELQVGGRALITGVRPQVESTGTAPTITVRVGRRDTLTSATTYTAATSLTSRTGYADCRVDGQYLRAEITIVGDFQRALGLEFMAVESGDT